MKIDINSDDARKAINKTIIDDLAVHDTALIYESFCVKDGGLYIPNWITPANLADSTYNASGIILRIEILPGKRMKGNFINAAKAQNVAKGNQNAQAVLSKDDYNKEVRESINRIFQGGEFGVKNCDEEQKSNPLRQTTLYSVESINGFSKLSELLAAVKSKNDN
ncbi:MAG: hypothetical protein WCL30_03190 [Pseudomonadota bacterium]